MKSLNLICYSIIVIFHLKANLFSQNGNDDEKIKIYNKYKNQLFETTYKILNVENDSIIFNKIEKFKSMAVVKEGIIEIKTDSALQTKEISIIHTSAIDDKILYSIYDIHELKLLLLKSTKIQ